MGRIDGGHPPRLRDSGYLPAHHLSADTRFRLPLQRGRALANREAREACPPRCTGPPRAPRAWTILPILDDGALYGGRHGRHALGPFCPFSME